MPKSRKPGHPSKIITVEDLSDNFHLPINDVARKLGLCVTVLKQRCRENGITRWPYRKVRKLDNCNNALDTNGSPAATSNSRDSETCSDRPKSEMKEEQGHDKLVVTKETRDFLLSKPISTVHLAVGRAKIQHQQNYKNADVEGGSGQDSDTHSRMQCADAASWASFQVPQARGESSGCVPGFPLRKDIALPSAPVFSSTGADRHTGPLRKEESNRCTPIESRPSSILFGERGSAFVRLERAGSSPNISTTPSVLFTYLSEPSQGTDSNGGYWKICNHAAMSNGDRDSGEPECSSSSCPPPRNTTHSVRAHPYAQIQSAVSTASPPSALSYPYGQTQNAVSAVLPPSALSHHYGQTQSAGTALPPLSALSYPYGQIQSAASTTLPPSALSYPYGQGFISSAAPLGFSSSAAALQQQLADNALIISIIRNMLMPAQQIV
mmetsp:Transcript_11542/g.19691  ORF Transcript_11542/g.19691 Transcript_11542/m.19691 type:complete len:438 (+) Transcript_11542:222-1535(+)